VRGGKRREGGRGRKRKGEEPQAGAEEEGVKGEARMRRRTNKEARTEGTGREDRGTESHTCAREQKTFGKELHKISKM
jgi:hypothetical protein